MASLYKRATPSQAMVLRIVEGAVKNTTDAHSELEISPRHRRSIAKRAAGTLTANWPDVLAAKPSLSDSGETKLLSSGRRQPSELPEAAGRRALKHTKRSPLGLLRGRIAGQMTAIRLSGNVERYEAWRDVLRMIAELGCPR